MRLPFVSRRRLDEAVAQNRRLSSRLHHSREYAEGSEQALVRYELRIDRLARACARYRAALAIEKRVVRRLGNQLLDATGYRGEPLLPAARTLLDLTEEDTK
ncbi:hypothetical protein EAO71_35735 [Streptomyces sp. ms191]|uniref:hypothetical protein n=1 Tax=Streptomyces sp. ms191 TaxID=1827978 RepID=UPI0011CE33C6|nr:hypothetical protein [Streptomyces sp. ms191]TXS13389.1 hypothetical protein EAO71_35735 [Streptomyces sp. ms191]